MCLFSNLCVLFFFYTDTVYNPADAIFNLQYSILVSIVKITCIFSNLTKNQLYKDVLIV